jgi:hypothetical protein
LADCVADPSAALCDTADEDALTPEPLAWATVAEPPAWASATEPAADAEELDEDACWLPPQAVAASEAADTSSPRAILRR